MKSELSRPRLSLLLIAKDHLQKLDPNIWMIPAISIFAWAPLLTPAYFFDAHDAKHSIFFLVEFDQTFRDGFLWPRWSPDFSFGYGYPLFNLYAPLAFHAAELFHLLGVNFTSAIKIMYILATIGAGLGMYGFGRHLFGRQAGLLAAVVYMYVPFHLVEIYVRSAYAEFVALALIPLLFWTFSELITAPTPRRVGLAGLAYGLLALTHHSSFFTFTPLLMVYVLYLIVAGSGFELKALLSKTFYATGAGLLGVALAAIYLVPVLFEMRFVKIEQWTSGSYNYLDHFVYFSQFFSPDWGYGYAGAGLLDDFSFQLGIVATVLVSFAIISICLRRFRHRGTALFFLIATIVTILLMSPLGEPMWQITPIASLVQFPWRLLGVTAFTISMVSGSLLTPQDFQSSDLPVSQSQISRPRHRRTSAGQMSPVSNPRSPGALYLLLLVVILGSFPYTLPQYTDIPPWSETPLAVVNWDRASIVDRVGMVAVTDEQPQTSPLEQEYLYQGYPTTVAGIISGQGTIETLRHGGASDEVRVIAQEPVTVQFYTYDYPGWQVTLNGQLLEHRHESPFGLITVDVPAGEHILLLRMGSTPPRTLGTIITALAVATIATFLAVSRWPRLRLGFDN